MRLSYGEHRLVRSLATEQPTSLQTTLLTDPLHDTAPTSMSANVCREALMRCDCAALSLLSSRFSRNGRALLRRAGPGVLLGFFCSASTERYERDPPEESSVFAGMVPANTPDTLAALCKPIQIVFRSTQSNGLDFHGAIPLRTLFLWRQSL